MSEKTEQNAIKKAKDLLNVKGEYSLLELYLKVKEFRNNKHPDRFKSQELKEEASKKFKIAQEILEQLNKKIEKEKLEKDSTELSIYEPIYEKFGTEQDLEEARNQISNLKQSNKELKKQLASIEKSFKDHKEKKLQADFKNIEENYKPSKKSLVSLGASFFITTLALTFSKVEELSTYFFNYSPIDQSILNTALFTVFLALLLLTVKKYAEHKLIKRKATEVISPKSAKKFIDYLEDTNRSTYGGYTFYESEVFDFIEKDILKSNYLREVLSSLGFKYYQDETTDLLKNIFIENLINKKLVDISKAKDLDRSFLVKR